MKWIPIAGRDAGPEYPSWINPAVVATASWWTDRTNRRVCTLELTTGRKVELRELDAHQVVADLVRGGEAAEPEPHLARVGCGRQAA